MDTFICIIIQWDFIQQRNECRVIHINIYKSHKHDFEQKKVDTENI